MWLRHTYLPTCDDCKKWMYDVDHGWIRNVRGGQPQPRPLGVPTPCQKCPKLDPEDRRLDPRPEKAYEFTARMRKVYHYYLLCSVDRRNTLPIDSLTLDMHVRCKLAEEEANSDRLTSYANRPIIIK